MAGEQPIGVPALDQAALERQVTEAMERQRRPGLRRIEGDRIVRGTVDGKATPPTIVVSRPPNAFTITDNGVGDYTVNFTPAFADVPVVVVTGRASTSGTANITKLHPTTAPTAAGFRVQSVRFDTGAADDVDFHFTAIGP